MATSNAQSLTPTVDASPIRDNYLTYRRGVMSWLFTLDHKRIGVMYLVGVLFAFFLGGIFALLIRTELISAGDTLMDADMYNQVFTLHGVVMVFMFIIPGIPATLGNFFLPIMLGAKDVAFPRLNLLSWWLFIIGAIVALTSVVGLDTGWTLYTPYSTGTAAGGSHAMMGVIPVTAGAFIMGFSSILTGVNFIATIHMLRPRGMTWFRMPLMLWSLYATGVIQILATPVLGITLLLLIADRGFGLGIFDPAKGGDPILYQHFFWFYSHPAVYIMILPAMGIISEVVSTHSHKHIFGYKFIAFSSLAIALLGMFVWGHHMFVSGQSDIANAVFSFLTFAVAIPSAIKVFNWLATMYKGSIDLGAPMLYAMSFIWVFTIGGLTGVFLGSLGPNIHLHDTYFVVAHFHYVMVGGTVFAFMSGLHHWWPKMFGRLYSQRGAMVGWLLVFVGFNLTFFPQFVLGGHGMPRRYHDWGPQIMRELGFEAQVNLFGHLHLISSIGSYVQAIGFLIVAGVLVHALFRGRRSPDNPWGSPTLEWTCSSPPPHDNFATAPVVGDPYDMTGLVYDRQTQGYVRRGAGAGSHGG